MTESVSKDDSGVHYSDKHIKSKDGTKLYVQKWYPLSSSTDIKAELVIAHGYLEHGGRYKEVSSYLATNASLGVTVLDFRGHGKSSGMKGYVDKFEQYHEDLQATIDDVLLTKEEDNKKKRDIPFFILGHSNGGLVALDYYTSLQETVNYVNGIIITSPWLAPANDLAWIKIQASKILGTIMPTMSMPSNDVTSEMLTRDKDKVKAHDDDDLILHNFTVGWAFQSMKTQKRVIDKFTTNNNSNDNDNNNNNNDNDDSINFNYPLLFVISNNDMVANTKTNIDVAHHIKCKDGDKTIITRKDNYHECLNEIDRVELYDIISEWITKHI